jgi:hypothetical protein
LQTEFYLEREHNARRTAPGVAHATTGITANVLTLPSSTLARDQLNSLPTRCAGQRGGTRAVGCPSQCQASQRNSTLGYADADVDAAPQEGMVFHREVGLPFGWPAFDIWDLQGAFDQFLRQAARLIAKDPHFPQPPKNSINFQIQNRLLESSRNRGINLPSGCPADHHLLAACTGIRVPQCRDTTSEITLDPGGAQNLQRFGEVHSEAFRRAGKRKSKRRDRRCVVSLIDLM